MKHQKLHKSLLAETNQYNRSMWSLTSVRVQAEGLPSGFRHVGSGTGAVYRRRHGVEVREVDWTRSAETMGERQGTKVVKHGTNLYPASGGNIIMQ